MDNDDERRSGPEAADRPAEIKRDAERLADGVVDGIQARRQGKISTERVEVRVRLVPELAARLQRDADALGCPLSTMAGIAVARAYGAVTDLMGPYPVGAPHLSDHPAVPPVAGRPDLSPAHPYAWPDRGEGCATCGQPMEHAAHDIQARLDVVGGGITAEEAERGWPKNVEEARHTGAHFHADETGVWQLRDATTGERVFPRLVAADHATPADLLEQWANRDGWIRGTADSSRAPSLEHRQGDDLIVLALHDEGVELRQLTDSGWRHTLLTVPEAVRVMTNPPHPISAGDAPVEDTGEDTVEIVDQGGKTVKQRPDTKVQIVDGKVAVKYFTDPATPSRATDDGHRHRFNQPLNGDGAEYRKGELFAFHRCQHCTLTTPEPKKVRA